MKKNHIFADDVRVDYFSLLHCSWIWRTKPYCYSLVVWAKSVAPNSIYCKIFENFMGSYLMCTSFWNVKGATKASVLIPWQRSECSDQLEPALFTAQEGVSTVLDMISQFQVAHWKNFSTHLKISCRFSLWSKDLKTFQSSLLARVEQTLLRILEVGKVFFFFFYYGNSHKRYVIIC